MTTTKIVAALAGAVLMGVTPAMAQYLPQNGMPWSGPPSMTYLPQTSPPPPPIVQPPVPVWRPPVGGIQPVIIYPGSGQTLGLRPY